MVYNSRPGSNNRLGGNRQTRIKARKDEVWTEGMALPPGGRLPPRLYDRTFDAARQVGSGTIQYPRISWLLVEGYTEQPVTLDGYISIERIVRVELLKLGLTHAWIFKEGHGNSTVRTTKNGARVISDDDYHIPLRMGTGENWCNLHGHFYLVYEDDDPSKKAIRMMEERERGIRGGKNPHLWTWGGLPPGYASPNIKYPETPYEIVPNSILDKRFSRQAGGSKGVKT